MSDDIVTRLRHVAWLAEEGSEVTDLAATAADEIERLRRIVQDRNEWNEHLSKTVSSLLLAVPRPFRMAVNRKAVRLLEEEARRG